MADMRWNIERDIIGDIKVSIPRQISVGKEADFKNTEEWTIVGVAWASLDTPGNYGVYDIKAGGGPLSTDVVESNAIQTLLELARKYYAEEWN